MILQNNFIIKKSIFWCIIAAFFFLAWTMQNQFALNADVSWLLLAAKRLLNGGTYTNDFFEINPPMILYLYFPAVIFAKFFYMPHVFRLYVFALVLISFAFSFRLGKKIFSAQDSFIANTFFVTLMAVLLLLPIDAFGQREHLLVIFTVPYFLLVTCPSERHPLMRFGIGVFAGFGFALKPFFLLSFLLVELYCAYRQRKAISFFRPEVLGIIVVFITYSICIYLFNRDYLTVVLPIIVNFYYKYVKSTTVINENSIPKNIFIYSFLLFFYGISNKKNPYRELSSVLMLAALGFLMAYILQDKAWYYQLVPFISFCLLVSGLLFSNFVFSNLSTMDRLLWSFFLLAYGIVGVIFFRFGDIWTLAILWPASFFIFFALLSLFLLYANERKINSTLIKNSMMMLGVIFLCYLFSQQFLFNGKIVCLFTVVIIAGTYLYLSKMSYQSILFFIIGSVVIGVYAIQWIFCYIEGVQTKRFTHQIVELMQPYQGKKVIFLSYRPDYSFPSLYDTLQTPVLRQATLGWGFALAMQPNNHSADFKNKIHFFVNALTDDINKHKPNYIFVDISTDQMNYLNYLSQDKKFAATWKSYRYVKTIKNESNRTLEVYEWDPFTVPFVNEF